MAPALHIAQELLNKAHPPDTAAAIFKDKILHKPLHLRPSSPDPHSQDARAQRRLQRLRKEAAAKRRRKVKPLSAKEKHISGVHDIPKDARRYDIYVPLHRMWLGYMQEILGVEEGRPAYVTAQSKGSILASADYHGAEMMVVRARCASLVGLHGIVVKDTKFTFQIITNKNELKIIPKRHTIFRFEIPQSIASAKEGSIGVNGGETKKALSEPLVFELHGSEFENRATDRATKKFKQKYLKDL